IGAVPPESDTARRDIFAGAVNELGRRAGHHGVRLAIETGTEPGATLRSVLEGQDPTGLAASIDPAALLQNDFDPVAAVRELGPWVDHAYATDATRFSVSERRTALSRGSAPRSLLWEEYLGALEEIDYRGYLTVWPDPSRDVASEVASVVERLRKF